MSTFLLKVALMLCTMLWKLWGLTLVLPLESPGACYKLLMPEPHPDILISLVQGPPGSVRAQVKNPSRSPCAQAGSAIGSACGAG